MAKPKPLTFSGLFESVNIKEYEGFVYKVMELSTTRFYIGLKHFRKGADYKTYTTSCKELSAKIKAKPDDYSFKVISLAKDESALKFEEVRQMMIHNALTAEVSYNNNASLTLRCKLKNYYERVKLL